jgi:hypothetical protein
MSNPSLVLPSGAGRRPAGLGVIASIQGLFGGLGLIGGAGALAASALPVPQGLGFLSVVGPAFPLVMIALGVLMLVLSVGLWQGARWAWIGTLVLEALHIVADVGFVLDRSFALDKAIGLVIIVGVLIYLTRADVRAYFAPRSI